MLGAERDVQAFTPATDRGAPEGRAQAKSDVLDCQWLQQLMSYVFT